MNTATAARRVVFLPTPTESFEAFRALERYAAATRLDPESGMNERLAASEDLNRVFARFGVRVFEEATCKR